MFRDAFAPSEHTAALLLHLRRRFGGGPPGRVVEIGTGSGVVLTAVLAAGAAHGFGVDIEPEAVRRTQALLESEGLADRAQVVQGSMWSACRGQRFDLAVANLPHFPATRIEGDGRAASWSCGGADGRRLLDEFLEQLGDHLLPGGAAVITHNVFVDLGRTREMVARQGLGVKVVHTASAPIPMAKFIAITPEVLHRFQGQALHRTGGHAFGDFQIVEIRAGADH
jgi:release factor glutamine methyltransferase